MSILTDIFLETLNCSSDVTSEIEVGWKLKIIWF